LLRDQTHLAAGLLPLRFSHAQIRYEPDHVRSTLRRTAAIARGGDTVTDRLTPLYVGQSISRASLPRQALP